MSAIKFSLAEKYSSSLRPPAPLRQTLRYQEWFDRTKVPVEPPYELSSYVGRTHHISLKQVPNGLVLKNAGNGSIYRSRAVLEKMGFPIGKHGPDGFTIVTESRQISRSAISQSSLSSLSSILRENEEANIRSLLRRTETDPFESDDESAPGGTGGGMETPNPTPEIERKVKTSLSIAYDDVWKILAARNYEDCKMNSLRNTHPELVRPLNELLVWHGDVVRITEPLSADLLGPHWKGSARNKIRFDRIADTNVKMYVVMHKTFWGHCLRRLTHSEDKRVSRWAVLLRKRIHHFFEGKPDPIWTKQDTATFYSDETPRNKRARAKRFIELLKTVDGIFLQRFLACPEEVWTWSKYDLFNLKNLSYLLSDEFLDGELTEVALTVSTSYAQLKQTRKWFKEASHKGAYPEMPADTPDWLLQWAPIWDYTSRLDRDRKIFVVGIVSQTRGSGQPPPVVILQSKIKMLETVSKPTDPLTKTQRGLIRGAVLEVIDELPDSAFTGLTTKARVSVTTSATIEKKVSEGGTTQTVADAQLLYGSRQIPIRDLETGKLTDWKDPKDLSPGERIFWVSLHQVMRTPLERLRDVFLVVVKEPGKARSITKSLGSLKIVLGVINGICSWPLKKGISSSSSGMTKSHHGWNFFKSQFADLEEILFDTVKRERRENGKSYEETTTYRTVYVSSTDYETATDYMHHEVACILGDAWMRKCGIPRVLRGIVTGICYGPRNVHFFSSGGVEKMGNPTETDNVRSIRTSRGILMGDPLTKVVLHLVNICTRRIASKWGDPDSYARVFGNPFEVSDTAMGITNNHGTGHT